MQRRHMMQECLNTIDTWIAGQKYAAAIFPLTCHTSCCQVMMLNKKSKPARQAQGLTILNNNINAIFGKLVVIGIIRYFLGYYRRYSIHRAG